MDSTMLEGMDPKPVSWEATDSRKREEFEAVLSAMTEHSEDSSTPISLLSALFWIAGLDCCLTLASTLASLTGCGGGVATL